MTQGMMKHVPAKSTPKKPLKRGYTVPPYAVPPPPPRKPATQGGSSGGKKK
jgi:hypothetical protein